VLVLALIHGSARAQPLDQERATAGSARAMPSTAACWRRCRHRRLVLPDRARLADADVVKRRTKMKKMIAVAVTSIALTVPASAENWWRPEPLKGHNIHAACLLGWAALAMENGATVEQARNEGWRKCQHIENKGMDSDRKFYLNDIIDKVSRGFR
jgi:hypothetical protein